MNVPPGSPSTAQEHTGVLVRNPRSTQHTEWKSTSPNGCAIVPFQVFPLRTGLPHPPQGRGEAGDKRTPRSKGMGLHSKATAAEGLGASSSRFWMPHLPPRSSLPCPSLPCSKAPNVVAMLQTPSRTVFQSLPVNVHTPCHKGTPVLLHICKGSLFKVVHSEP